MKMHDGRLMGGRWMDGGEVFLFDRYCHSVLGALEFGRGFLYSTSLLWIFSMHMSTGWGILFLLFVFFRPRSADWKWVLLGGED